MRHFCGGKMSGDSADRGQNLHGAMDLMPILERLVAEAQILKKPARIRPNFSRIHTGKRHPLTMPNIRPDLIRI